MQWEQIIQIICPRCELLIRPQTSCFAVGDNNVLQAQLFVDTYEPVGENHSSEDTNYSMMPLCQCLY